MLARANSGTRTQLNRKVMQLNSDVGRSGNEQIRRDRSVKPGAIPTLPVIQALLDELSIIPLIESSSELDANALSKDAVCSNPAVDSAAIIADLESVATNCLHEVKIFGTPHSTEHDVSDRECGTIDRHDRAEVAGFDSSLHRCASGSKRNGLSSTELFDVMCCPTHIHNALTPAWGYFFRVPICNPDIAELGLTCCSSSMIKRIAWQT